MFDKIINQLKNAVFGSKPTALRNMLFNEKKSVEMRPPAGRPSAVGKMTGFAPAPKVSVLPKIATPTPTMPQIRTQPQNINLNQPGLSTYSQPKAVLGTRISPTGMPKAQIARPTATPTAYPTPVPGVKVAGDVEKFIVNKVFPITRQYGIPDSVAAGQFAQEGRFKGAGAAKNNFFNVGFTDAKAESGDYSTVPRYNTPEEGIEAYARFVTGQANDEFYANGVDGSKWGKIGKKQLQEIAKKYKNDPEGFLQAVGPMYSSQGEQYYNNVATTPEYRRFSY